jgi:CBS domain-containing protein
LYVIRRGAVEILDDGRLIDLMGEGEVFGTLSVLAGFSPTATVRAHEDTLCYLIPGEVAAEVLGTEQGLAFVMGSLRRRIVRVDESLRAEGAMEEYRSVGSLVRRPPVTCEAGTSVADAAAQMARERVSCLLIDTGIGWGILTDRDLRARVVAAQRDPRATQVAEVMTYPATTVPPDTMAGEVMLRMLEGGFHHFPIEEEGRIVGVVTDTDLMGLGRHTPFATKSGIERARDRDEAVAAARDLPSVVTALVDASADPVEIGHIVGLTIDALTRRLLQIGIDRAGEPPVPWAWLALGSAARQEQAVHTDQDHALAYDPQGRSEDEIDPYFAELAEFVTAGLEAAGIPRCNGDAMAANRALRKSVEGWRRAFHNWMAEPGATGSVLLSIVFDYRRVMGPLDAESPLDEIIRTVPGHPQFMRHLSRRALDERPPTGFFRDLVVQAKGEHAGRFDIKHGGITIIGNLARAYAIGAGLTEKRTLARLRAAQAAGVIDEDLLAGLEESFRFLWDVRLQHHVARLRAGEEPDDFVDPTELGPVTRHGLKEAFKVIMRAQRTLSSELGVQLR